jgi:enoyl-CoA hydratase/carnithine racemase
MTEQRERTVDVGEPVLATRTGPVLTVTLNRPARKNAMDEAGWRLLHSCLRDAAGDPGVRVVVVTGSGGNFCAGADLSARRADEHPLHRMRGIGEIAQTLHEMPKPVIAKVAGVAVGAGCNVALGCDLVVASTSARFSQIFSQRGLSLDFGGSWVLPRIVGLQQAKRLALLADFVDADEALRLGMATWVKGPKEIDRFVDELAERLAALPPVALAQSKTLLNQGIDQTLREALDSESRAQAVNFATEDAAAAFRAFTEKRPDPAFTGRWAVR